MEIGENRLNTLISIFNHPQRLLLLLFTFLLCFYWVEDAQTSAQVEATRVTVKPASGVYPVGSQFSVQIWIEDVVDLYGADVRLSFDPTKLRVVDPNPGTAKIEITALSSFLNPSFLVKNEADNSAGTVWYAAAQMNPDPEVSGSGAICSFTLQVLDAGVEQLVVTYQLLSDKNGEAIPAQAFGANYELVDLFHLYLPLTVK